MSLRWMYDLAVIRGAEWPLTARLLPAARVAVRLDEQPGQPLVMGLRLW
jgi:hypothetical protein